MCMILVEEVIACVPLDVLICQTLYSFSPILQVFKLLRQLLK